MSVTLDPPDAFNPDAFGQGLLSPLPLRRPVFDSKYELMDQDVDELRNIFERFLASKIDSTFDLAVRRFNLGYDRESDEDRLIDYWIALESLFAPDSTQELRFRAALRIARYVGDSKAEREWLFNEMKASYDLRSKVVHGGNMTSKLRQQLPRVVNQTEETLRKALRSWLDPRRPHTLEDIDAGFLS